VRILGLEHRLRLWKRVEEQRERERLISGVLRLLLVDLQSLSFGLLTLNGLEQEQMRNVT
jgi:hypothetical protein